MAAWDGNLQMMELLLEGGAGVDVREPRTKMTAYHCACIVGQVDAADLLVRSGVVHLDCRADKMARITSDCGMMRSMSIKWP